MKTELVYHLLIGGILVFLLYGVGNLAYADYEKPGGLCPKLMGIPACYIILACVLGAVISFLLAAPMSSWVYFVATGLATTIAVAGTVGQLSGLTECPKTSGGTPMCFISLGVFSCLILLKVLALRQG